MDRAAALIDIIATIRSELCPRDSRPVRLDSRLDKDLGLDSLARVELLARIEAAFAIRLPEDLLGTAETVGDLLVAVSGECAAGGEFSPHQRREGLEAIAGERPDAAATLADVLAWHVQRHADRPHVLFQRTPADIDVMTHGELLAAAREVAAGLRAKGVRAGDFVALMLPTGLDFFHSFHGILLAGAVPVPIYPPTRPAQVEDHLRRQAGILRNCEAVALVSFDAARMVARILSGLAPGLRAVTTPEELRRLGATTAGAADHHGGAEEIAFLQYTSGSTGNPKGVTLDHGNLLANIRAWGQAVALTPSDVVVSWLPLYHDMGLIGAWLGSLYHGCPLVLMSPLDFLARPERWLWAIHEHRGTVTAAPNFAFELCLRHADPRRLEGLDLSSWRYAANGAEPVAADTLARFTAAFRPYGFRAEALAPVYGLAECSVGLAVSPPGRGPLIDRVRRDALAKGDAVPAAADDGDALRLVACGRSLPGHELRIVDEAGQALPPRRVGRIEFRGPSATRGYYRNAEATARLMHAGWLDSGDLGYLADGDLVITGRIKDMIIRGGRNLYPYELEEAVGAMGGIRRGCVAVFGAASAGGTERLVVVAESRESAETRRRELLQAINERCVELLGSPPDEVVLAPPHAVLKTSSGKIRRAATREAYLAGKLGRAGKAPWRQLLRLGLAGGLTFASRLRERGRGILAWLVILPMMSAAAIGVLLAPTPGLRWRIASTLARRGIRLCGMRIECEGADGLGAAPTVFVANHASYLDVFVLLAALPCPVRFVAKQELRSHALIAVILRRLGTVFVDRFDARRGIEDLQRFGSLAADTPLFFFPEGTFTSRPGLLPFRLGAFQLAAREGRGVVPVGLSGTREALPDGSWSPRRGTVRIVFASRIEPGGGDWTDVLRLRDASRQAILAHCGEADLDGEAP